MEYIVAFYDDGYCCVDIQQFSIVSLEELNEKARDYADALVNKGRKIAGWTYWDVDED